MSQDISVTGRTVGKKGKDGGRRYGSLWTAYLAVAAAVAGFLGSVPTADAAVAYVQSASGSAWGASASATFPSAVTAGDIIAVAVGRNYSPTSSTIADDCGAGGASDAYTVVDAQDGVATAYAVAGRTGACTVTYAWASSGTSETNIAAHEISGVDATNPVDAHASYWQSGYGDYTAADSISSGAVSTSHDGDYLFGATQNVSLQSASVDAGAGYVLRQRVMNSLTTATEDRVQPAAGSAAATFTNGASCNGGCTFVTSLIAFAPAISGQGQSLQMPPSVASFSASPSSIGPGSSATLSWDVSSADAVTISGIGPVATSTGSVQVSPATTTGYVLTATNAAGTTTATASVAVVSGGSIGPVDTYLDLSTSTSGAHLTAALLNAGTQGVQAWGPLTDYGVATSSTAGMTVATSQHGLLAPVKVGPTVFPASHQTQSIALDNGYYYEKAEQYVPSGHRSTTIAGWVTLGPPDAGVNGSTYDLAFIYGAPAGDFAGLQLRTGAPTYHLWIETGTPTVHSNQILVTPGATYWFALNADYAAGLAKLAVFDVSGNQVGSTVTAPLPVGDTVSSFLIGNDEIGVASSTTYFEDIMADYTNASFPLGPLPYAAPTVSSVMSTPATTTAQIAWTTSSAASSQVAFGTTTAYGSTTAQTDLSPLVTSHAVALGGLSACTTYHYQVGSVDAFLNGATSTDQTFTTAGCSSGSTSTTTGMCSLANGNGTVSESSLDAVLLPAVLPPSCPAGYICIPMSSLFRMSSSTP
ncbi:MAG: fibronectin type III domain-containing protein [Patescibacteria group bacterium]|nr:fibronectin type III domain-containing protein [Patescibacteria group bacterium]